MNDGNLVKRTFITEADIYYILGNYHNALSSSCHEINLLRNLSSIFCNFLRRSASMSNHEKLPLYIRFDKYL